MKTCSTTLPISRETLSFCREQVQTGTTYYALLVVVYSMWEVRNNLLLFRIYLPLSPISFGKRGRPGLDLQFSHIECSEVFRFVSTIARQMNSFHFLLENVRWKIARRVRHGRGYCGIFRRGRRFTWPQPIVAWYHKWGAQTLAVYWVWSRYRVFVTTHHFWGNTPVTIL